MASAPTPQYNGGAQRLRDRLDATACWRHGLDSAILQVKAKDERSGLFMATSKLLKSLITKPALMARRMYWWIFRPETRGVRALVLDETGRVVLVQHSYDSLWYFPGGRVRKGEDATEALRRELSEELGTSNVTIERSLGVYSSEREFKKDTIEVFVARVLGPVTARSVEISAARSFPLDQVPQGTSSATKRRLSEYLGHSTVSTAW